MHGGGGPRLVISHHPASDPGAAVIFFPGFLNGELDQAALHAGLPPVGTKYVSQVPAAPRRAAHLAQT